MATASVNDIPVSNEEERELVKNLDSRLQAADIDQLGWRGRQDLDAVMHDLKKLSVTNWAAAEALWDRNDGELKDKPDFLDKRSRATALEDERNEPQVPGSEKPATISAPKPEEAINEVARDGTPAPSKGSQFDPPEAILKRFLRSGPEYYFRDDEHRLAFKDDGKKLQTTHNEPRVALAMVEMAQAHGWTTIKVKGSEDFRREAWLQGSLKGLEVHGYKPNDIDRAMLDDKRATLPVNEVAPLTEKENRALDALQVKMRGRGDSEKAISEATALASQKLQQSKTFTGVLMEHGRAPYENNAKNPMSYFAKLDTKDGVQTVWGSGIARAVKESGTEIGQSVVLASTGQERVPIAGGDGKEVVTTKHVWSMVPLDRLKESPARYAVERAAEGPSVKVFDAQAPKLDREQARQDIVDLRRSLGAPHERGLERSRER